MRISSNPVLNAYNIPHTSFRCYDVSGLHKPVSIRDQVLRVCSIVDQARFHGLIDASQALLIVGGGIAGSIGAIKAAKLGISVDLVDWNEPLKNVACTSLRQVCPTEYDWTASHWLRKSFPLDSNDVVPVTLKAGEVKHRAEALLSELTATATTHPLNISPFIEVDSIRKTISNVEVSFRVSRKIAKATRVGFPVPPKRNYGVVIACTGIAPERTWLDGVKYLGQPFWTLSNHDGVLDEKDSGQKILICGSGDGALQDFLLLVTKHARVGELYSELNLSSGRLSRLETAVSSAEDVAKRKELWVGSPRNTLCSVLTQLHKSHKSEVANLLAIPAVRKRIHSLLRMEADRVTPVAKRVTLMFNCVHFSSSYPLNRFMALLISEYLNSLGINVLRARSRVESVDGVGHKCRRRWKECAGFKKKNPPTHSVTWLQNSKCSGPGSMKQSETYNRVFTRFGLDDGSTTRIFRRRPAITGLQVLPYSLP